MQNVPPMQFRKSDRFFVGQIRESVVSPAARQKYRRDDDERKDNEKWQNWWFFELNQWIHGSSFPFPGALIQIYTRVDRESEEFFDISPHF
jgi:hypothetical protein